MTRLFSSIERWASANDERTRLLMAMVCAGFVVLIFFVVGAIALFTAPNAVPWI